MSLIRITIRRNGGTFAHWQIALAYTEEFMAKENVRTTDLIHTSRGCEAKGDSGSHYPAHIR